MRALNSAAGWWSEFVLCRFVLEASLHPRHPLRPCLCLRHHVRREGWQWRRMGTRPTLGRVGSIRLRERWIAGLGIYDQVQPCSTMAVETFRGGLPTWRRIERQPAVTAENPETKEQVVITPANSLAGNSEAHQGSRGDQWQDHQP